MKHIDVIIFGGQSNMQGQTECLSETAPVAGAQEYRWCEDALIPLANPVGENIRPDLTKGYPYTDEVPQDQWLADHVTGSACYGYTNMVPSFCRAYIAQTGAEVLAVHAAKGSTEIAQWLPGTAGFSALTGKAKAALAKIREDFVVDHIFFAWLQGESDAIYKRTKAYYKEKITELCDALRTELGVEKFGIVRVGRFTNDDRDLEIIGAQDEVCAENDAFLMLTDIAVELNKQPIYMNPVVEGHYSAKGLEKLGAEAGTALGIHAKSL